MKHPLIILGSAGALLMLGGAVWMYLFLFYQPAPENARVQENPFVEVQADEFGMITGEGAEEEAQTPETMSAGEALTTRRVAGAVALNGMYRFVEAGTGHAYETGVGAEERKISNTTFPQTIEAVWAPSGEQVIITRETDGALRTFIVTLDSDAETDTSEELVDRADNIAWSEDSTTLKYTRQTDAGSQGVARTIATKKETVLFNTPLRDVTVQWEPTPLIVTKATRAYMGYAYRSDFTRVADGMPALGAVQKGDITLFTAISGNNLMSWFMKGTDVVASERAVIPEKCALIERGALCASPKKFDVTQYPDEWYRGEEVYDDELLYIDAETGVAESLGDLGVAYRMPLDIVHAEPMQEGALMQSRDGHAVLVGR